MLVAMCSLSEITSLFDLSRYLDRSLGSAKVLSQKVKSPIVYFVLVLDGDCAYHTFVRDRLDQLTSDSKLMSQDCSGCNLCILMHFLVLSLCLNGAQVTSVLKY